MKICVGLSGGVDSSVAARLCRGGTGLSQKVSVRYVSRECDPA